MSKPGRQRPRGSRSGFSATPIGHRKQLNIHFDASRSFVERAVSFPENIEIQELQLHAPTLDDVFLAKTGRKLDAGDEGRAYPVITGDYALTPVWASRPVVAGTKTEAEKFAGASGQAKGVPVAVCRGVDPAWLGEGAAHRPLPPQADARLRHREPPGLRGSRGVRPRPGPKRRTR